MLTIGFNPKAFSATFRERMAEWGLSFALAMWAAYVLSSPNLFEQRPYFHPLQNLMDQHWWGVSAMFVGAGRLILLAINGGWRPSAGYRAIGCAFGCIFWIALMVGALSVEWRSPAAGVYFALYLLDTGSAWFAAKDAVHAEFHHHG